MADDVLDGTQLISAERRRQISQEGWSPDHDDEHDDCALSMAASGYLWHVVGQVNGVEWDEDSDDTDLPPSWPWESSWWKPSDDPIRNLVKAGALIAAEIDRLQRKVG